MYRNYNQEDPCCPERPRCPEPKTESCRHDHGPEPCVINIAQAAKCNRTFRTVVWTGNHMQLTVMCIPCCDDIGLEVHANTDQFICLESGRGIVRMGDCKENLYMEKELCAGSAILIPAGTWHNVMNTSRTNPLKVYTLYAPPQHPRGTVHCTKACAEEAEKKY